jgi:hypothetical protein
MATSSSHKPFLWMLACLIVFGGASVLLFRSTRARLGDAAAVVSNAVTGPDTYTVEVTDVRPPADEPNDLLTDDNLAEKRTEFDPGLIDRRPLEGWRVNASDAVLRLDAPMIRADLEGELLALHPSYASAVKAVASGPYKVLPSVNMIDGKAKQFDDGLYAALDLAYYRGLDQRLKSHVRLVRDLFEKVGAESPAAPFLAAGLSLAGETVRSSSAGEQDRLLKTFLTDPLQSKPLGFYTWSEPLSACFRFLRYFQQPISEMQAARAIARALSDGESASLRESYAEAVRFYSRLTNPPDGRCILDYLAKPDSLADPTPLFPTSTSPETQLFRKLFPTGLPPDADLMRTLIVKVRLGDVDLAPRPDAGWYAYQIHALETLLLPERGPEYAKLLLTKSYKKRMLEAFKALLTKRRETHVRNVMPMAAAEAPPPPTAVEPRLRVEPALEYYLRTARAYGFLANFLEAAIGEEALKSLHGLRQGGLREPDLRSELLGVRELFYGCYLIGAEDIGWKPAFLEGESVDREACEARAREWLEKIDQEPDLAADTRVSVPIAVDPIRNVTRIWATLGVRLAKLDVSYVRTPRIRPKDEDSAEWKMVEASRCRGVTYYIPVDEFAEVELRGPRALSREELRAVCDAQKTKESILKSLRQ